MKKCIKCGLVKPYELFPKRKSSKDGYRNSCKKCESKYHMEWQNRMSISDRREYRRKYKSRNRKSYQIKLTRAELDIMNAKNKEKYKKNLEFNIWKKFRCRVGVFNRRYNKQYKVGDFGFTREEYVRGVMSLFNNKYTINDFLNGKIHLHHKIQLSLFTNICDAMHYNNVELLSVDEHKKAHKKRLITKRKAIAISLAS